MKRLAVVFTIGFGCAITWSSAASAQGRDWMTSNGDAQRSAWVRSDAKISRTSMQKPGFQFLWKLKMKNAPRQLNSLTTPSTLERLIGYRGFRMLGFVGGSSDNVFTIDTDLGRMEWEKHFNSTAPASAGTVGCPGGMTTSVVRPTLSAISSMGGGGFGGGRSNPAKSAVGEPGKGAVTLANVPPNPPGPPPGANPPAGAPAAPRPNPANPPGGQFGRGPFLVYALSSDGMLHSMHLSNGADFEPAVKFLPPNANANGLIVVDGFAYVVTEQNCSGTPNGVWAMDLTSKQVMTWKGNVVGAAGPAFSGDGTIFVATGNGGEKPNSLVALDPKTLAVKSTFSAGNQEFSATPVLFDYKGKTLVAATTKDGRVHLFDSMNLNAPLSSTAAGSDSATGALASWQDTDGTRWLLAPQSKTVVAWKIADQNGAPALQQGWASRELVAPITPTIINGVAFVISSGEFRTNNSKDTALQRAKKSVPAVIYALDATTGKELWNSGTTITSFVHGGALSGGMGQIYLGTYDGTFYAFGFPMEH